MVNKENPFASPRHVDETPDSRDLGSTASLTPLWIWLAISFVFGFAISPADTLSLALVMGFNLILLWQGALLATRNDGRLASLKYACAAIGIILWIYLLYVIEGRVVVSILYVAAGTGAGAWCWRTIPRGRLTIFACFSIGYVLGALLGLVGLLPGAVVGAIWGHKLVQKRVAEAAS